MPDLSPTIRPETANPLGSTDANEKIARLEKMVRYLLLKAFTGEKLLPSDAMLREFLVIGEKEPSREEILRRIGAGDVLGVVTCPKCGSKVQDISGVLDERCGSCGTIVPTER